MLYQNTEYHVEGKAGPGCHGIRVSRNLSVFAVTYPLRDQENGHKACTSESRSFRRYRHIGRYSRYCLVILWPIHRWGD